MIQSHLLKSKHASNHPFFNYHHSPCFKDIPTHDFQICLRIFTKDKSKCHKQQKKIRKKWQKKLFLRFWCCMKFFPGTRNRTERWKNAMKIFTQPKIEKKIFRTIFFVFYKKKLLINPFGWSHFSAVPQAASSWNIIIITALILFSSISVFFFLSSTWKCFEKKEEIREMDIDFV